MHTRGKWLLQVPFWRAEIKPMHAMSMFMIHSRQRRTHLQSPECPSKGIDANTSIEPVSLRSSSQQMIGNWSLCLCDVAHLIILTGTWVQRPAQVEFGEDTAQWPHVNSLTVRQSQQNLRCPINMHRYLGLKLKMSTSTSLPSLSSSSSSFLMPGAQVQRAKNWRFNKWSKKFDKRSHRSWVAFSWQKNLLCDTSHEGAYPAYWVIPSVACGYWRLNNPFCSKDCSRDCQCFWMGRITAKIAHSCGGSRPHLIYGSLGPHGSDPQTTSGWVQRFLRTPQKRLQWFSVGQTTPKIAPSLGDLDPHPIMVPWAHESDPKRYLNRYSRFCRAHNGDQHTDRQTDKPTTLLPI